MRRACLARAVSFCCTMRRRETESLSWTLILLVSVDEGAMVGAMALDRGGVAGGWMFGIDVLWVRL